MSISAAHPPDASPEVLVKRLFARISEVSSLPAVALRIVEVANDVHSDSDDLLEAVQYDAALATRIMRTVNSSYYSLQNKVADLKLAITLLGFKEIRNLSMTAYVAQLFKRETGYGSYSRPGLWNHMVGSGLVARLVAETSGKAPPREAYLAGLLHDLGLILIDQYLHKPFCQLLDTLGDQTPLCAAEREVLGFDHAALGQYVATRWNLPEHLVAAIAYHHDPEAHQQDHHAIVCAVALANYLCHIKGLSSLGVRNAELPPASVFAELGLREQQIASIWDRLDHTLQQADFMAMMQAGG